jgi:hypothetical protein
MQYTELAANVEDIVENTFTDAQMAMLVRQAEQKIYNTVPTANLRKNVYAQFTANNQYLSAPTDFLSVYSIAVITGVTGAPPDINTGTYAFLINKDVNFIREAYPQPSSTGKPKHYAIFGPRSDLETELTFIVGPTPDEAYYTELHYYYYPESIVQSAIATLGAITAGSSYTNGTYFGVPLTGGSGSGATAKIVVSGGAVTSVTLQNPGVFYAVGNTLSCAASSIGGTGSGFSIPVATVSNANGVTWLGENFDIALLNGTILEAARFLKAEPDQIAVYNDNYGQSLLLLKNLGDGKQRTDAYRDGIYRVQPK